MMCFQRSAFSSSEQEDNQKLLDARKRICRNSGAFLEVWKSLTAGAVLAQGARLHHELSVELCEHRFAHCPWLHEHAVVLDDIVSSLKTPRQ